MRIFIVLHLMYLFQFQSGVQGACKFIPLSNEILNKTYFYCGTPKNWNDAKQECENNNWMLPKITSDNDSMIFSEFFQNYSKGTPYVWTGLKLFANYTTAEQYGEWSDGSLFYFRNDGIKQQNESYAAWHKREPIEEQELCVHLLWRNEKYAWDNWKCSMARQFFCEKTDRRVIGSRNLITPLGSGITMNNSKNSEPYYILKHIDSLPATRENTEAIMTAIDEVLAKSDRFYVYPSNPTESRKVVRAFHDFIARYLDGEAFITRSTIDVAVNISSARDPLTYEVYTKSGNAISLHLDTELLQEVKQKLKIKDSIQIGSIAYRSAKLFEPDYKMFNDSVLKNNGESYLNVQRVLTSGMFGESEQVRLRPHLLSDVISAEVSKISLKDLKNKLKITIQLDCEDQPDTTELQELAPIHEDVRCAFWNVEQNIWSTSGCRVVHTSGKCHNWRYSDLKKIDVTCECDHMTHFAAVLDTSYTYAPVYIGYLNMIGCIVSAFFLLLTVVTMLSCSHMRNDTNKRIILNIAINLFVVNLIFVIGIDGRKSPALCLATSFLLHYFTLTSWLWMLIEALHLLLTLSLLDRNNAWKRYMLLVSGILAYVIPGVIAAVAMIVSDRYTSVKCCWIAPNIAIYALAIPIGIILAVNVAVAIYTMYKMTCGFKLRRAKKNRAWINMSIQRSFCLAFLLGLPWTFGMLMLLCQSPQSKDVFAAIFAVCNMLQGLIIFVAFCAMDDKLRNQVATACSRYRVEIGEKLPTLASYTKPSTDKKKNEKQSVDSTAGSQEIPSRKTTATTYSPSPLVKNRQMNPALTTIASIESLEYLENDTPTEVSHGADKIDDEVIEENSVRNSDHNSVLEEESVECVAADITTDIVTNVQISDLQLSAEVDGDDDITTDIVTNVQITDLQLRPKVYGDDDISTDNVASVQFSDLRIDQEVCGQGNDISQIYVSGSCVTEEMISVKKSTATTRSEIDRLFEECVEIASNTAVVVMSHGSELEYSTETNSLDIDASYLGQPTERPFRSGWV